MQMNANVDLSNFFSSPTEQRTLIMITITMKVIIRRRRGHNLRAEVVCEHHGCENQCSIVERRRKTLEKEGEQEIEITWFVEYKLFCNRRCDRKFANDKVEKQDGEL